MENTIYTYAIDEMNPEYEIKAEQNADFLYYPPDSFSQLKTQESVRIVGYAILTNKSKAKAAKKCLKIQGKPLIPITILKKKYSEKVYGYIPVIEDFSNSKIYYVGLKKRNFSIFLLIGLPLLIFLYGIINLIIMYKELMLLLN